MIDPREDGITHINIYSQGRTHLGRFLSNFGKFRAPTDHGLFDSIEGYWYYLGTDHPDREELRNLSGFPAKKRGRELRSADWSSDQEFRLKIARAIVGKILTWHEFENEFVLSKLPFTHYYVFGSQVKPVENASWIVDFVTNLRQEMQNNYTLISILNKVPHLLKT